MEELSFELSRADAPPPRLPRAPEGPSPAEVVPAAQLRQQPPLLPRLSEPEVMRHFARLAALNYSVSRQFYPLGSCTMKYNPVVDEALAGLPGFADLHPYQDGSETQGALILMRELESWLCRLVGVDHFCLQPAAGAHGEWTGLLMVKAYHARRGDQRDQVLVPDSAHGTNPASAALAGFEVEEVRSRDDGRVDLGDLLSKLGPRTAALMLTNPNTLGLFETDILEIAAAVHDRGALLYYDGANLNALVGLCRPGDMGFDVVHLNLHKTFSTPHGGGGPGAGPVGVKRDLADFMPVPRLVELDGQLQLDFDAPASVGRVRSFTGNFGMLVRAYAYILAMGADGLAQAARDAVLSANYLRHGLAEVLEVPQPGPCKHEFVASARPLAAHGVRALDVAKALLDRGFYAPTVYFPLIVPEAMMIEPTETETKATLDSFTQAIREIAAAANNDPEAVLAAPLSTPVGRLDEVEAARDPVLRWDPRL